MAVHVPGPPYFAPPEHTDPEGEDQRRSRERNQLIQAHLPSHCDVAEQCKERQSKNGDIQGSPTRSVRELFFRLHEVCMMALPRRSSERRRPDSSSFTSESVAPAGVSRTSKGPLRVGKHERLC